MIRQSLMFCGYVFCESSFETMDLEYCFMVIMWLFLYLSLWNWVIFLQFSDYGDWFYLSWENVQYGVAIKYKISTYLRSLAIEMCL